MSSPGAPSAGPSTPPIYSSGPSTPPSYSSGSSTPPNYSPGSSRNAECSNCKHLRGKISRFGFDMELLLSMDLYDGILHVVWVEKAWLSKSYKTILHASLQRSALSDTGIEVMISVVHKEVLGIAKSPSAAASWINIHVLAFKPATNVAAVATGSEFFSSNPNAGPVLVIAINNLYKA
ncbi:glucan endo-1,3-beta-glucosidase 4-like protein [Tanacetum coccineum]